MSLRIRQGQTYERYYSEELQAFVAVHTEHITTMALSEDPDRALEYAVGAYDTMQSEKLNEAENYNKQLTLFPEV